MSMSAGCTSKGAGGGSKRRRRSRSSHASSRGPHGEPDTCFHRPTAPACDGGGVWHQDAVFSRFWQHYSALMYTTHLSVLEHAAHADDRCCCQRRGLCPQMGCSQSRVTPHHAPGSRFCNTHKHRAARLNTKRKPHRHGRQQQHQDRQHHQQQRYFDNDADSEESTGLTRHLRRGMQLSAEQEEAAADDSQVSERMDDDDNRHHDYQQHQGEIEEEPVLSAEFLAFMETTLKHREQWRLKKAAKGQSGAGAAAGFLALDITAEDDHDKPKQEHPDTARTAELQKLYGAAAPRLHAMETSVQLAYERVATRHNTQLWPNIPINVMFGDD